MLGFTQGEGGDLRDINALADDPAVAKAAWPIWLVGAALGLLLSYSALSGDTQGRVNLLYLLTIFVFFPGLSIVVSLSSLLWSRGLNLGRIVRLLPFWGADSRRFLTRMDHMQLSKYWLFMQSQAAAVAYAAGSLLVFLGLLVATDVNFVWRSTVLQPKDLQPVLKVIALPWWFWEAAQPTESLLRETFDSRLAKRYDTATNFTLWWPFVLAALTFYALILRGLCFIAARKILLDKISKDQELKLRASRSRPSHNPSSVTLPSVISELPDAYHIANWANFDASLIKTLPGLNHDMPTTLIGPLLETSPEQHSWYDDFQVLLVKAWEPPMGELQDKLADSQGVIFPVDIRREEGVGPKVAHLDEWRRFSSELSGWQVYLPQGWCANEA